MQFSPLHLSELPLLRPLLSAPAFRTCDLTVGGLFPWRHFFKTEYALENGILFTRLHDKNGTVYYNTPLGASLRDALLSLRDAFPDDPLRFCTVPKAALPDYLALFPNAEIEAQRNYFDYLYPAEALASLAGKKYNGQRNQISQFKRAVSSFDYIDITPKNVDPVYDFFLSRYHAAENADAIEREENRKVSEILQNLELYRMFGGALYADGRMVGFSLGERVGDTVFVHIEKADRGVKGAYQMLVKLFAEQYAGNALYINREDDAGDMGLRTAKLSYHPCELLEKYTVLAGVS